MDSFNTWTCRTCLKTNKDILELQNQMKNCPTGKSYKEVLKDLMQVEFLDHMENHLPQSICHTCCEQLESAYNFVAQAQQCFEKLISNLVIKPLDCLVEQTIDMPMNETDTEYKNVNLLSDEMSQEMEKVVDLVEIKIETENILKVELRETIADISPQNVIYKEEIKNGGESLENFKQPKQTISQDSKNVQNVSSKSKKNSKKMTKVNKDCVNDEFEHTDVIPSTEAKGLPKLKIKLKKKLKVKKEKKHKEDTTTTKSDESDENRIKCKFCEKAYLNKYLLLRHLKMKHKQAVKKLKKDMDFKSEVRMFIADEETAKTTQYESSTSESEEDADADEENPSKTSKQQRHADDSDDEEFLRYLLKIKSKTLKGMNSLPKICDICTNVFKTTDGLRAHKRYVHASEDDYFACTLCDKKYKRKNDLKIHIQNMHTTTPAPKRTKAPPERRFMCTYCSYCCTSNSDLNVHIRSHHTGEKPFKCDLCDKAFIVAFLLKRHRYIHTGERPYKCPYCEKGFRDNFKLKKHKRTHTNERPFHCDQCDKTFAQKYGLTVHKRTHYKALNLICNICGKVFSDSALLNLHRLSEQHLDEVN